MGNVGCHKPFSVLRHRLTTQGRMAPSHSPFPHPSFRGPLVQRLSWLDNLYSLKGGLRVGRGTWQPLLPPASQLPVPDQLLLTASLRLAAEVGWNGKEEAEMWVFPFRNFPGVTGKYNWWIQGSFQFILKSDLRTSENKNNLRDLFGTLQICRRQWATSEDSWLHF